MEAYKLREKTLIDCMNMAVYLSHSPFSTRESRKFEVSEHHRAVLDKTLYAANLLTNVIHNFVPRDSKGLPAAT
jgi:hypothetical protein